jgi:hypothetical protein
MQKMKTETRTGSDAWLRRTAVAVRAAAVVVALICVPALGYDAERTRAYFARELAECAAWYALVAEAPGVDDIRRIRFRAVSTSLLSTSADIATEPWALTQMDVAKSTIWNEMRRSWDKLLDRRQEVRTSLSGRRDGPGSETQILAGQA